MSAFTPTPLARFVWRQLHSKIKTNHVWCKIVTDFKTTCEEIETSFESAIGSIVVSSQFGAQFSLHATHHARMGQSRYRHGSQASNQDLWWPYPWWNNELSPVQTEAANSTMAARHRAPTRQWNATSRHLSPSGSVNCNCLGSLSMPHAIESALLSSICNDAQELGIISWSLLSRETTTVTS